MARHERQPSTSRNRYDVCAVVSVVLACVAVYANSLHNPLLRDDKTSLIKDSRVQDAGRWRDIFTQTYWHGLSDDPIYRPLTTLSFLLNRMALGKEPWAYRSVNIALHAMACVAVYMLGLRLLAWQWGAWLTAILFAVHAVHTEPVTAIVGRADIIVALLLAIVAWLLLGRADEGGCEPWRWAAIVGLSVVAMFFKEAAFAVLPLAVFIQVWQWWVRRSAGVGDVSSRRYLSVELGLAASIAAACVAVLGLRYGLFGPLSRPGPLVPVIDNPLGLATPMERVITAIGLVGKYLRLLVWPHPLCCDYSYPEIPVATGPADRLVLIGLLWLVGVGVALWVVRRWGSPRDWQLAVFCVGFFLASYSIVSNAVVPIGTIFGERLTYMPSVAMCLAFGAVATGLSSRVGRHGRIVLALACGALLCANAFLTIRRNSDWRDRMALWQHAVQASTRSSRAWSNLSKAYQDAGNIDEAIRCMRRSVELYDGYWETHHLLGEQLARKGRFGEAAVEHRHAYELAKGGFKIAPAFRLGQCYMELKEPALAIGAFRAVLALKPDHLAALNNLAYYLAHSDPPLRDLDAAAEHIDKALKLAPNQPMLVDTAVDVYVARGQRDRAVRLIREAIDVAPDKTTPLHERLGKRLDELTATSRPTTTRP